MNAIAKCNSWTYTNLCHKHLSFLFQKQLHFPAYSQLYKSSEHGKSSRKILTDTDALSSDSSDMITQEIIDLSKLAPVNGFKSLVEVVQSNKLNFNVHHACQAIIMSHNLITSSREDKQLYQLLENDDKVQKTFMWLLNFINSKNENISDDIFPPILHIARTFQSGANVQLLDNLLDKYFRILPTENFNSLRDISSCVRSSDLNYLNRQVQVLHNLLQILPQCHSPDELNSIAICIRNLRNVVSDEVISQFYQKVTAVNEKKHHWPADVVLTCLRTAFFQQGSISEQKKIVNLLLKKTFPLINELSVNQLSTLKANMRFVNDDTSELEKLISSRALDLISHVPHPVDKFQLLFCLDNNNLQQFECAKSILKTSYPYLHLPFHIAKLFTILSNLECYDPEYINIFLSDSKTYANKKDLKFLLELTKGYVKFLLSTNNTYYHELFEQEIQKILLTVLNEDWCLFDREVSAVGTFFILTCRKNALPDMVVERILAHCHHFKSGDILTISECLKYTALKSRNFSSRHSQLLNIRNRLNKETKYHIANASTLPQLTGLTSGLLCRNKSVPLNLLSEAIDKHYKFLNKFSSAMLVETSRNINAGRYYAPDILDAMIDYSLKNHNVSTQALVSLLNACFRVGHFPQLGDAFFDRCTNALENDYKNLKGVLVLLASVALNMYDRFPTFLIDYFFSEEFLDILERDVEGHRFFDYAVNARYFFMLVNRIVCIEYPQYKIPWFHDKYCEERKYNEKKSSFFFRDVENNLCQLLGGKAYYQTNAVTPYFYYLSFECLLDLDDCPIQYTPCNANNCGDNNFQRIAINVLTEKNYCSNVNQLLGPSYLKRHHLEIMGYKIVEIPYFQWRNLTDHERKTMLSRKMFGNLFQ